MLDYGLFSSLVVCLSVVHTCQAGFSTELLQTWVLLALIQVCLSAMDNPVFFPFFFPSVNVKFYLYWNLVLKSVRTLPLPLAELSLSVI